MKNVVIVSMCLKVNCSKDGMDTYYFHFKGVCQNRTLKGVVLKGRRSLGVVKGEEYLIYVGEVSYDEDVLQGVIIKLKPLKECWDRS
jgi:hypothetical protein